MQNLRANDAVDSYARSYLSMLAEMR